MKKRILSLFLCLALMLGMLPVYEAQVQAATPVVPDLTENPVYVGGTALQYAGDSVEGSGGGTATLYICQDGNPALMLDNYVYEGAGYAYEENAYAGIYYGGSGYLLIMTGTSPDNRAASQSSITVNAENAVSTKGICVPHAELIIGKPNSSNINDILTVSAGPATNSAVGISAGKELETIQDGKESTYVLYTTKTGEKRTRWVTSGCVINAYGGAAKTASGGIFCGTLNIKGSTINAYGGDAGAEGYASPISYGISCTDATLSGGTINATGGKASYEGATSYTLMANTYGIKANNALEISGATVTATGGTSGEIVSGKSNNQYSYGCYCDNITVSSGSLTATGADMLWECSSHRVKESYGIRGGITASGGTITAIGGNTINGLCYGIYASGDCSFSGAAKVTAKTNDVATDDYIYGLYVADGKTITVADTAEVTVAVATEAEYESFGIYYKGTYTEKTGYTQTGGTVNVSAVTDNRNLYGAKFYNTKISGGTLNVSNKREALYATEVTLTGGEVKGISTGVLADEIYYEPNGVVISTLTMEGGSLTGVGGETVQTISHGVKVGTATVSGGTVTGTGGHVSSQTQNVTSYGTYMKTLTLSGGTVTGTGGTASSSSYGVRIDGIATLSNDAKLVGTGGTSERVSSYGISGDTISVSDSVVITGTGGQAAEESRGISVGEALNMSEGSSAKVTGIGGKGDSSIGLYISSDSSSLLGGSLTVEGGSSYTTESLGLYTWYYDFVLDGTIMTATGYTSAVGGSDKFVKSEAIVADADRDALNAKTLPYGNHSVSSLAQYRYLKAGTYEGLGVEPVKRDISDAVITLGDKLTYNGSEQTMVVKSVVLGGEDLLAAGDVTVTGNTVTNAGTYTLTVTADDDSNYTGKITKEFTVARLIITPTVEVSGAPYTYLSKVDSSNVTVKHGETVLVEGVDYSIDVISTGNVGENKGHVFVRCKESSNYNFFSVTSYFTVIKAENPIEMTTSLSVIRGGNDVALAYTNNKTGIRPSYSFVGEDLGCTISGGGTLTSGDTAGTVTVCATFSGNDYYNETTRTITVMITEKKTAELAVTQNDATYNYNDTTDVSDVSFVRPGPEIHKTIEYEGTVWNGDSYARSETKPTQAGEYTVYLTYETRDTIYTGSDEFVIKPRSVSVVSVALGEKLTYDGTAQTKTVTRVYNSEYEFSEEEYDITDNVQTNAGNYQLKIVFKGNFTGTRTVEYTIAKATPQLSDFTVPELEPIDYTGEYLEITPPTSDRIGMGEIHIETYVRDAGTYEVTFGVYAGDNYTAATGLVYGTLTVNQVYRPTTTTNAEVILGGNEIDLDSYVSTEGYPAKNYEIDGDAHGCSISNGFFTSGSEACTVTVQVTLEENKNYKETVKTFTVTVKNKKTASLTVTQPDVEYNYNKDIGMLSPTFTGQTGTEVSRTIEYEGTIWNGSSYARSEEKPTQAGTYTVYVTYESKDTIYTGNATFKINPRQIGGSITLGDALTYTGEPQTQTVAKVTSGDYTYTAADYDISDNVQTNAGEYILTLTGKGNFTGTTSRYYTIKKATPQLSDFDIPELTAVDYTGEFITVALPTSTKNGMGKVYLTGANDIKNAGNYKITFGVYSGDNYTAAGGFEYGTLTVNKVAHPMTVTNAVVGINRRQINLSTRVTTAEFGYFADFEFVTPEEERLGCQLNGATFTSGTEAGTVTVRATVREGTNYLETSKTFTVEVVEVGGVEIWGYVKSSGSSSDETIIQLLQDGEVKHETVKYSNNPTYLFDGVAAGTHILRVSKKDHVTYEKEITVASDDLTHVDVQLVYMIGDVAATCEEFPSLLTAGENLPVLDSGFVYTTEPSETVLDADGIWQKKNGEYWEEAYGEIEAGDIYRYKTTLKMDGENTTCTLADAVTLKVNDISWTVDYDTMQNSKKTDAYVTVYSPEIVGNCIVSFASGGGTGTMEDVTGVLGEYILPECGFTAPEGMRFKAWSVDGMEKAVSDEIEITANTVVTAIWEDIPHVHVFDREVATDAYKASKATCKEKATYYKSCECGEKGVETFEYGELAPHTYNAGVVTKQPTETETGVKTYTCSVCGATKTEVLPIVSKKPEEQGQEPNQDKEQEQPPVQETTPAPKGTVITDGTGISYKVTKSDAKDGTVTYTKTKSGISGSVTIPDTVTIDGITYKITTIEANAFKNNKKITKVTIGENVVTIGKSAFMGCSKLTSVTIGKNVKTIGAGAFSGCSKLKTLKLGASIATIGDKAFYKCTSLTKITIPSKVSKIGKSAFMGCSKLTSVTMGKNVKTIGAGAFSGCSKLKTLKLGASVTTIGDKAFYKCTSLTKVTIPSKVSKIGKSAFYGCMKLKNITINTTKLTSKNVGKEAFKDTPKNAVVKVPKISLKAYLKFLNKKGIHKKAKIKK